MTPEQRQQAPASALSQKGWAPPSPDHPLALLSQGRAQGQALLVLLGPSNRVGADYFQMYLSSSAGPGDTGPVLAGLSNRGRYPQQSWVEVGWSAAPHTPVEDDLFRLLAETILPGGHMMVEYESPARRATVRALAAGVPPLLTPLGAALFQAGCGCGFKDWYISEGWTEGPRKLQGFKALDSRHRLAKAEEMAAEAVRYLQRPQSEAEKDMQETARSLARQVLPLLSVEDTELRQAVIRQVDRE